MSSVSGSVRSTRSEAVVARLRDDIRRGLLEPGSRLRQDAIAARFGTSTTPVREAFQALQREGLVDIHPHRGAIVFRPSIDLLVEIYEIRIPLEALAVEKAVANMTSDDIEQLAITLTEMATALDNSEEYGRLNAAYHHAMYRPAGRPRLLTLIEALREESGAYLRFYAAMTPSAEQLHREHIEIFEACQGGRALDAARAVSRHLQHTVDYVSTAFRGG
jgi:DNA-binding GntR family transcriptional regulator